MANLADLGKAAGVVRAVGLIEVAGWSDNSNVEIASDAGSFARMTGTRSATTGAATICVGGRSRLVINPVAMAQSREWFEATIVHESVHLATNSACSATPTQLGWAVEGIAESVAAQAYPATAEANRRLVQQRLALGIPDSLPLAVSDPTDYALAQVAADAVRAGLGAGAADFFDRAKDGRLQPAEVEQARQWYLSALARLAASAGVSGEEVK